MATMKITVDELRYKKAIYTKAAKNLREVIAVVKKASNSIGNDRMFAEARQSLHKLAENMDRRATVLEALADALVYSADTYKGAQTHSVSQISDYRAHKTDFYGKAVHVSAAGGAAAAMAGGTSAAAASVGGGSGAGSSAGSAPAATATASTGAGTQAHAYSAAAKTVAATSNGAAPAAGTEGNTTINVTNVYNNTETVVVNASSGGVEAPAAVNMSSVGSSPAPAASVAGSSSSGIGMFAAGAAAAVGAAGVAFGTSEIIKNKKNSPDKKVDNELEAAKKKLQAIEDEQDVLRASIAESEAALEEETGEGN